MKPADVPLKCACGKLRGTAFGVSPSAGCRLVCYCNDCQAFARFLGCPDVTNRWGGTDIFQMAPAKLHIGEGIQHLRCLRLSNKGMHRWYCGECMTPVGNTLGPRGPFVGVIHSFMDHRSDGRARDEVLGEPLGHLQIKSATGNVPSDRRSSLARVIGRSVRLMGKWWITGARQPSPFFDKAGKPRAEPRVLRPQERQALDLGR